MERQGRAAEVPNKQFNVTVNMSSFGDMLQSNSGLYQTIGNRPLSLRQDAIVVWLTVSGMPVDEERLLYTSIIYDKVVLMEAKSIGGDASRLEVRRLTPISTPQDLFMSTSQCNPWLSATTLVWCVTTPEQRRHFEAWANADLVKRYKLGPRGLQETALDDPLGRVNWEQNSHGLANTIFNVHSSGRGVEFTRPRGGDVTAVTELWERNDRGSDGNGCEYNFEYKSSVLTQQDPKRQRTGEGSSSAPSGEGVEILD